MNKAFLCHFNVSDKSDLNNCFLPLPCPALLFCCLKSLVCLIFRSIHAVCRCAIQLYLSCSCSLRFKDDQYQLENPLAQLQYKSVQCSE